MKRIAWILDTFPSRSETFIARDIAALRARGFAIEVFALRAGEGARPIEKCGLLRADWARTGDRLGETLEREDYGHIHAGWASHPAEIATAAAAASGLTWSFSGHARDLWVEGRDWKSKLASASFAHSCTQAGAAFLISQSTEANVVYAPHGLDLTEWPYAFLRPAPFSEQYPALLMGVGRLVPKKGWDVWLHALNRLREHPGSHWRAAIIGEGPEEASLRNLIRSLGLEDRVELRGALPTSDVRAQMQQASLLAFTGRTAPDGDRDGLPNVLLEAAALGLAIVATRAGAVEEFGAEALLLCPPDDPAALAAAMDEALADQSASAERAKQARQIIEERFAQDTAILPLVAAFEKLLGGPARDSSN